MPRWFDRSPSIPEPVPSPAPATSPVARAALRAELTQVTTEWETVTAPRHATVHAHCRARTEALAKELQAAQRGEAEAQVAQLAESTAHARRVAALEAQLRAGAPSAITEFLVDARAECDTTRGQAETHLARGPRDPYTDRAGELVATNAASIERRLDALASAMAAATAMQLEILSEAEVLARLANLRDSIPAIEPVALNQLGLHSPGELRAIEWQAADSLAGRSRAWR